MADVLTQEQRHRNMVANTSACLRLTSTFGKRKLNGIRNVIKRNNANSLLWVGIASLYGNVS